MQAVKVGDKFGKLVVVADTAEQDDYNNEIWACRCDCGRLKYVAENYLIYGITKSCGCLSNEKAQDLTGEVNGQLTALMPVGKSRSGGVVWACQCDCGKIIEITAGNFKRQKSCGCSKTGNDLTGQRFGKLVVMEDSGERSNGNKIWCCQCDCGNVCKVMGTLLKSGKTRSCGCETLYKKSDITGQRFGMLTALRPTDKRKNRYVVWECQCDCGQIVDVDINTLRNNRKQSCGCNKSRTEIRADVFKKPSAELIQNENVADMIFMNEVWSAGDIYVGSYFQGDTPEEKPRHKQKIGKLVHARSKEKMWLSLELANHECEIDRNHQTFISKNKDVSYTEGHHLVPLAYADCGLFDDVSLDVPANIISLCPGCHSFLHNSKEAYQMLEKIYEDRKQRLADAGIFITFEQLLKMYGY